MQKPLGWVCTAACIALKQHAKAHAYLQPIELILLIRNIGLCTESLSRHLR